MKNNYVSSSTSAYCLGSRIFWHKRHCEIFSFSVRAEQCGFDFFSSYLKVCSDIRNETNDCVLTFGCSYNGHRFSTNRINRVSNK